MADFKQNAVSAAVWPWTRNAAVSAYDRPAERRRAIIQAVVVAVISVLFLVKGRHPVAGTILLTLAAWLAIAGFFLPRVFRVMEKLGQRLGSAVGTALTWMLLVPFFYLCFLPGHLLLRSFGKDPLKLKFPSDEPTYWTHRPPVIDVSRFRSQY